MLVTLDIMAQAFPALPRDQAQANMPFLNATLDRFDIDTNRRIAAFFAQIGHESLDLTVLHELPHRKVIETCNYCKRNGPHDAGAQYEGRVDLGNTKPGFGVKYVGRGWLQNTGYANYYRLTQALGIDFLHSPELLETAECAALAAGLFWHDRKLNDHADVDDFDGITFRVNGGYNGKPDRDRRWAICKRALGVVDVKITA